MTTLKKLTVKRDKQAHKKILTAIGKKMGKKNMDRQVKEEEDLISNKYTQTCSTSVIIREIENKT
jgi:hypothetical protein